MSADILVVDDEEDIRSLLKRFLEIEGYQCEMAADGKEALELLSNKDSKPEAMYIIKIFIEKFYNDEIKISRVNKDESLKRIKNVFTENYS